MRWCVWGWISVIIIDISLYWFSWIHQLFHSFTECNVGFTLWQTSERTKKQSNENKKINIYISSAFISCEKPFRMNTCCLKCACSFFLCLRIATTTTAHADFYCCLLILMVDVVAVTFKIRFHCHFSKMDAIRSIHGT